ncbi:MAG: ribose-phosphate diphosphokinase [Amphiplicatus sp.]
MSALLVAAMPGEAAPAQGLAKALKAPCVEVDVHHFPDGESRVRVPAASPTAILYCSLNDPNAKLIEVALAASALRDLGASRLVLVAPYLCYMRQDTAFRKGEAVSQRVIGEFLAGYFERVVTIEPHLHRIGSLADVFPDTETNALSAAPLLAALIRRDGDISRALIAGPDAESQPWAEALAVEIRAPHLVLQKARRGDSDVSISLPGDAAVSGRRIYLVDDVLSTGATLAAAAKALRDAGAESIEGLVVHALCGEDDLRRLRQAGITRIRSTDSVKHPTNAIECAPILTAALTEEGR